MNTPKLKFIDYKQYNHNSQKSELSQEKILQAIETENSKFERLASQMTLKSSTLERDTIESPQVRLVYEQIGNEDNLLDKNELQKNDDISQANFLPEIKGKGQKLTIIGLKTNQFNEKLEKKKTQKKELEQQQQKDKKEQKEQLDIKVEWQPFKCRNSLMLQTQIRQQKTKLKEFKNMKPILGQSDQKLSQNQMKDEALQYIILREEIKTLTNKIKLFMIKA